MCGKIFTIAFIAIAVLMAILASVLPPEQIDYVIVVSKFFDVMIPVLAVGALLKYLCHCQKCGGCDKCKDGSCSK